MKRFHVKLTNGHGFEQKRILYSRMYFICTVTISKNHKQILVLDISLQNKLYYVRMENCI